jgi:hypothetical protein
MSTDAQFTATGPGSPRFQTSGDVPDTGANISGAATGGAFHSTASVVGGQTAAVKGDSPYGSGFIAGNANDDPTNPNDRPRGVYGESYVSGGVGVEGIGLSIGVAAQLGNDPFTFGMLGCRDPVFQETAGVYGESPKQGITGATSSDGPLATGVYGFSRKGGGVGVRGETVTGVAVQGKTFGAGLAGKFIGDVQVDGHITAGLDVNVAGSVNVIGDITLANRDLAERFRTEDSVACEPGMVVVMGPRGAEPCGKAYDRRVLGVVSGAGALKPAITLGVDDAPQSATAVALSGTVYCRIDADFAPVQMGDLLTASPTPGHAMKAVDPALSFGAVIGKALDALPSGRGLVPMIVSLL